MRSILLCFFLLGVHLAAGAATQDVFRRYQDRLVQIRILEASAGSQAAVGSGFFASAQGLIVTNYHVISDLVQQPTRYRGEVRTADGQYAPLRLVDFDAVHDLALVATTLPPHHWFELERAAVPIGMRAFSIGTPLDLGFTIVEGTYNGLLENSLYEKIHFTGAINPGMSGGPTVLANGRVVGVNVATAGNQVSFLVPAKYVQALLARTQSAQSSQEIAGAAAQTRLRDELWANQASYMQSLIRTPLPRMRLGHYLVPGKIASFIKCWGDATPNTERHYDAVLQQCSSEDDLFVSRSQTTGIIHFQHTWLAGRNLNRFRFYDLYQDQFNTPYHGLPAGEDDVSKFECHTDFVLSHGVHMKTVLCLRRLQRLAGLYDAVLKVATLNENHRGVLTTLVLAGVSARNAYAFSQHFLDSFQWQP